MNKNGEFNTNNENQSHIRVIPYIPLNSMNNSLKSQIAQMYINHFGPATNVFRPNTTNTAIHKSNRNVSLQNINARKSEPQIKLYQDKINFLEGDYPSIVLHPKENKIIQEKTKRNYGIYNNQMFQLRSQSAQKESKRSMSQGNITGITQNTNQNTQLNSFNIQKDITPTTNNSNYSDSFQASPYKKAKKVVISYRSGRSLSKSQCSFSQVSQKVIKEITSNKQIEQQLLQKSYIPYIEYQNLNQIQVEKTATNNNSYFTNTILKQNINTSSIKREGVVIVKQSSLEIVPKQNQEEQQLQKIQIFQSRQAQKPQISLIQSLQNLKKQQQNNERQKSQSYYPIQPFSSKFKIIHQKKVLVKDVY